MRKLAPFAALACAALVTPAGGDDKGAPVFKGRYAITAGERSGRPIPEAEIKGTTVRFTDDEVIVTDKDDKQVYVVKYTLDTSKKPYVITMTTTAPKKGQKATGLIEKEGEVVRLVYNLPGGMPPDDFKTDEKQEMFQMKPLKDGGK